MLKAMQKFHAGAPQSKLFHLTNFFKKEAICASVRATVFALRRAKRRF